MADRYKYNRSQLEAYFDRIGLPVPQRRFTVSDTSDKDKLSYLHLLQKHQLVKVPWENLTQHYSWHRCVNVKPQHLFAKIVEQRGRGGYCMEANSFFHTVLLSLGFDVYMAGSRIYRPETQRYGGWTHVVNLVSVAGQQYLLDGGFGGNGPSRPVPLRPEEVLTQIAPAQMRLLHEPLPQNLNRSQKTWIYQHRFDVTREWIPMYAFTDLEFLPEDIESMNFEPWLNPRTFFTHKVVAVRFTTHDETQGTDGAEAGLGEIDGALVVSHNVLTWRREGKKVLEIPFRSEHDRLQALERYFSIEFGELDRDAILGTAAQIGGRMNV